MPNATDPTNTNQYNYTFQTVQDWPRNDQVVRVDWNIAPKTTIYGRLQFGYEKRAGGVSLLGSSGGWPQHGDASTRSTRSATSTRCSTPSTRRTFAEFTVGVNWAHQYTSPFDQAARLPTIARIVLPGLPQFFPSANPLNLLPQASLQRRPSRERSASFGVEQRWPFFGYNTLWNVSGNLTKIEGAHNLKTGLFVEHTTRPAQRSSSFNGSLSFNSDGSNPLNTNVGFANALLGVVTQYQESDGHPSAHGQFINTEWYAQDNWRVKQNFTIDAGHALLLHHPDPERRRPGPGLQPEQWQRLARRRSCTADLDGAGSPAQNPVDRRDPAGRVRRPPGAGHRQLHQRHGGLRGHAAAENAVQGGAAPRLRVGRHRRRDGPPSAAAPACSTTATRTTTSST